MECFSFYQILCLKTHGKLVYILFVSAYGYSFRKSLTATTTHPLNHPPSEIYVCSIPYLDVYHTLLCLFTCLYPQQWWTDFKVASVTYPHLLVLILIFWYLHS